MNTNIKKGECPSAGSGGLSLLLLKKTFLASRLGYHGNMSYLSVMELISNIFLIFPSVYQF